MRGHMKPVRVEVHDLMQQGYVYDRTEPVGQHFPEDFRPQLTPQQMLELGVFGGKYLTDCVAEFPAAWFDRAKLSPDRHDPELNYFGVNASQPLSGVEGQGLDLPRRSAGLVPMVLPLLHGQTLPRRRPRQIKRWRAIRRHVAQMEKNCSPGDLSCRRKQRQAVLHWAYDSRRI